MEAIIAFMIRASLYLMLFAAGYLLLLRKSPQAMYNRFFILGAGALSLVLGFIPADFFTASPSIRQPGIMLPEIVVRAAKRVNSTSDQVGEVVVHHAIIWELFLFISSIIALMFVMRLLRIGLLIRRSRPVADGDIKLIASNENTSPFSFFSWVFVPGGLEKLPHYEAILAHERAHYHRLHSADVLFYEFLKVLFWFHPAVYFLRSELKAMHEFEADAIAIRQIEKIDYQKTLVELSFTGGLIPITNPFNLSLIKKRMLMMNRKSPHRPVRSWLMMAAIAAVVLMAAAVQSCQQKNPGSESNTAQQPAVTEAVEQTMDTQTEEATDEVFTVVEQMPEYNGGMEAMMKFIASNITYPETAKRDTIQGKVFVQFVIETDGSVSNVKVLRGIGGGCDEEAIRVVESMPKWTPGRQRGKAVRVSFNLPIRFALQ
ncbi:MAG: M56 family metallopeptidase [Bacteroidales bacterium]|nr:M56 family metallopeptidase [Bacteroidales bacterium]